MKFKKRIFGVIIATALMMSITVTAFAAVSNQQSPWANFNVTLPAHSWDAETGLVARVNSASTMKYFTVEIYGISGGYTAVRVWTENQFGFNFSNPLANSVGIGRRNINYATVPQAGDVVKLNLDNPVDTSATPTVRGRWTPN